MNTSPSPERRTTEPVVLVVEDHESLLQQRLSQLSRCGVKGVGATSAEDAAAFLTASSTPVSLVMVDVNLRPDDPADRSGLALARYLNVAMSGVPLVGYSGHFEAGAFSSSEHALFNDWIPKGQVRADELADRYSDLAEEVTRAATTFTVMHSDEAAVALAKFLADTERMDDPRVVDSRSYLHGALSGNPYDPGDGDDEPYDPADRAGRLVWARTELPEVIRDQLMTRDPTTPTHG